MPRRVLVLLLAAVAVLAPATAAQAQATAAPPYDNVGTSDTAGLTTGLFDGSGDAFTPAGLAAVGIRPGQPVNVGGVPVTWPAAPTGEPNNYIAAGQDVPVSGTGTTLALVGAGTLGTSAGEMLVFFGNHEPIVVNLTLQDWGVLEPAGNEFLLSQAQTLGGVTMNLFGYTVALPAGAVVSSVRLPAASQDPPVQTMHVFALGVGTPPAQPSADLGVTLAGPTKPQAAAVGTTTVRVTTTARGTADAGPLATAVIAGPGADLLSVDGRPTASSRVAVLPAGGLQRGTSIDHDLVVRASGGRAVVGALSVGLTPDPNLFDNIAVTLTS